MAGTFEYFDQQMMSGLQSVTSGQMAQYSSWMMGLAGSAVTVYVLVKGYQTMAGKMQTPLADLAWDLARLAIIFSFVANINGYLDSVISAISGLKEGFSGGDSIWQMLDSLLDKAQTLAKTLHDLDDSTVIKDQGLTAQFCVWLGVMAMMLVCAFVSLSAEVIIMLLSITAPVFIFFLAWGALRSMFEKWLQNIFAAILTIMFAALSLRIVVTYLNSVLQQATAGAQATNIVTLGAQVCLAGIGAGMFIWISAKLASSLAGASATATLQGMASMGVAAAGFGAASQISKAVSGSKDGANSQLKGWAAGNAGHQAAPEGGAAGFRASQLRQYAVKQMQERAEKSLAASSANVIQARFGSK